MNRLHKVFAPLLTVATALTLPHTIGCAEEKSAELSPAPPANPAPPPRVALNEIRIRPAAAPGAQSQVTLLESAHSLRGTNLTMTDLLCLAHRYPSAARGRLPLMSAARVLSRRALPAGRYDIDIVIPGAAGNALRLALANALDRSYYLRGRRAMIETDVLLLIPKGTTAQDAAYRMATESDTLVEASMSGSETTLLVEQLEERLGLPVVDESGRKGEYNLQLNWASAARGDAASRPDLVAVRKALQDQLGLDLIPAKRVTEMVLVDSLTP